MTAGDQGAVRPSGRQHEIGLAEQRAVVVEVGGGVRVYEVGGRPVLDPYPVDAMADGAHGTPLVPWPNRLRDGRYRFDGTEYQVPLTEPDKHNAIHGLLRWRAWRPVTVSSDRVEMGIRLHPTPGYPFTLDIPAATHNATQLSARASSRVTPLVHVPDRSGGSNTPTLARRVMGETSPNVSHTSAEATPESRAVAPYGWWSSRRKATRSHSRTASNSGTTHDGRTKVATHLSMRPHTDDPEQLKCTGAPPQTPALSTAGTQQHCSTSGG